MSMFTQKHFLQLIVKNQNKQQIAALLRSITTAQYKIVKKFAQNILSEKISLSSGEFKYLEREKTFIRKLATTKKISSKIFVRKILIIKKIIQIGLKNEIYAKNGNGSNSRMGTNKKQELKRNEADSDSSCSSEGEFADIRERYIFNNSEGSNSSTEEKQQGNFGPE